MRRFARDHGKERDALGQDQLIGGGYARRFLDTRAAHVERAGRRERVSPAATRSLAPLLPHF